MHENLQPYCDASKLVIYSISSKVWLYIDAPKLVIGASLVQYTWSFDDVPEAHDSETWKSVIWLYHCSDIPNCLFLVINYWILFLFQEWRLHSHVETWKRVTTRIYQNSKYKHAALSTSCRASRRPGFFIWNIFLVMVSKDAYL